MVNLPGLVGDLVVVLLQTGREQDDWNTLSPVAVVVAPKKELVA
jgi:hypothetical protein